MRESGEKRAYQELEIKLKELIEKELFEIKKPPKFTTSFSIKSPGLVAELLIQLLNYEVDEDTLKRVGKRFWLDFSKVEKMAFDELSSSIETLAANFESFLKKIAYLKYKGTKYWEGFEHCAGVKETTLYNLLTGKINNKRSAPQEAQLIEIPEPLVDFTSIKRAVLDFTREIRNQLHNSVEYSREELFRFSNIVIQCYLIAVEDNLAFLKRQFLPEYKYLQRVVNDRNLAGHDQIYVDLLGEEEIDEIDLAAVEVPDYKTVLKDIADISFNVSDEQEEEEEEPGLGDTRYMGSILEIAEKFDRFYLIGAPGCGKTATLNKVLYSFSKRKLDGEEQLKTPLLIFANEYSEDRSIRYLAEKLMPAESLEKAFLKGEILLIIDGVNELPTRLKYLIVSEIERLKSDYSNLSLIISSRKYGFKNRLDLPVFEIKELDKDRITSFIKSYTGDSASQLSEQINANLSLLKLASNPLLLKMIIAVGKKGGIPESKGKLFDLFIEVILEREENKVEQFDKETKLEVLGELAFEMRADGFVSYSAAKVKNFIQRKLRQINSQAPFIQFFHQLIDNSILKQSETDEVSFFHESYQEYFAAACLKKKFLVNGEIPNLNYDENWLETLQMASELFQKDQDIDMFFDNLIRGSNQRDREKKQLWEFNEEDINQNITVISKLGHNVRKRYPQIFKKLEVTLFNYLSLWYLLYKSNLEEKFRLELVFGAISSLGSPILFWKIFHSERWVQLWLFKDDGEESNLRFNIFFRDGEEKFLALTKAIVENLSDFQQAYTILDIVINSSLCSFFKSIRKNVIRIKRAILSSVTERELISFYELRPSFDVFAEIIKSNLDYIKNNGIPDLFEAREYKTILGILLKFHLFDKDSHPLVLEVLDKILGYNKAIVKGYTTLLDFPETYPILFPKIIALKEKNPEAYSQLWPFFQKIPYDNLPKEIQNEFNELGRDLKIPVSRKIGMHKYEIDGKYTDFLSLQSKLRANGLWDCTVTNVDSIHHITHQAIICSIEDEKVFFDIPKKGKLQLFLPHFIESLEEVFENYIPDIEESTIEFSCPVFSRGRLLSLLEGESIIKLNDEVNAKLISVKDISASEKKVKLFVNREDFSEIQKEVHLRVRVAEYSSEKQEEFLYNVVKLNNAKDKVTIGLPVGQEFDIFKKFKDAAQVIINECVFLKVIGKSSFSRASSRLSISVESEGLPHEETVEYFTYPRSGYDFSSPELFHRDQVLRDQKLIKQIQEDIENDKRWEKLIRHLGLSYQRFSV
jgi:hypothetical protein